AEIGGRVGAIVEARRALAEGLRALPGLGVYPSEATFLLTRLPDGVDATELRAGLRARGVAVRVFAKHPRLAGHVRITVGTPEENAVCLEALAALLPAG
ncbi:MAG: aminotransferase class I/II-fold pyridoxal phosphate-dependent enzyme, partial [Myxococcota bacterium]